MRSRGKERRQPGPPDNLFPVAFWLELVVMLATEIGVELLHGDQLCQVRIEADLQKSDVG